MLDFLKTIFTSGASAVNVGVDLDLDSYNPYPALMWILVFIVISLVVFIYMLLKTNDKNAKTNEVNKENLKDLERGFERLITKFEEHDTKSIENNRNFYRDLLNRQTYERSDKE